MAKNRKAGVSNAFGKCWKSRGDVLSKLPNLINLTHFFLEPSQQIDYSGFEIIYDKVKKLQLKRCLTLNT